MIRTPIKPPLASPRLFNPTAIPDRNRSSVDRPVVQQPNVRLAGRIALRTQPRQGRRQRLADGLGIVQDADLAPDEPRRPDRESVGPHTRAADGAALACRFSVPADIFLDATAAPSSTSAP